VKPVDAAVEPAVELAVAGVEPAAAVMKPVDPAVEPAVAGVEPGDITQLWKVVTNTNITQMSLNM